MDSFRTFTLCLAADLGVCSCLHARLCSSLCLRRIGHCNLVPCSLFITFNTAYVNGPSQVWFEQLLTRKDRSTSNVMPSDSLGSRAYRLHPPHAAASQLGTAVIVPRSLSLSEQSTTFGVIQLLLCRIITLPSYDFTYQWATCSLLVTHIDK